MKIFLSKLQPALVFISRWSVNIFSSIACITAGKRSKKTQCFINLNRRPILTIKKLTLKYFFLACLTCSSKWRHRGNGIKPCRKQGSLKLGYCKLTQITLSEKLTHFLYNRNTAGTIWAPCRKPADRAPRGKHEKAVLKQPDDKGAGNTGQAAITCARRSD